MVEGLRGASFGSGSCAARLQWEVQRADAAERARAAAVAGAQAAVAALMAKRAPAAPTTLETIWREILRNMAARPARERMTRTGEARAAARRTQSVAPGGMGQVMRAGWRRNDSAPRSDRLGVKLRISEA